MAKESIFKKNGFLESNKLKLQHVFFVGLFAIFLLVVLRFSSNSLVLGEESYHHLFLAKQINQDSQIILDNIYLRDYKITPYHILLAIFPNMFFANLLTFIFAVGCTILLYLILKEVLKESPIVHLMLFVTTPLFLYMLLFPNIDSLAACLTLLTIFLYLKNKFYSIIPLFLLLFFPPFNLLFILLLFLTQFKKEEYKKTFLFLIVLFLSISSFIFNLLFFQFEPRAIFSDFGSYAGLSIIVVLFGFYGIFLFWKKTKWFNLIFLLIFLLSLVYSNVNIYVNFYLCALAGAALMTLITRSWTDKTIRNLIFVLIFSLFLFSTLSFISFAKNAPPSKEIFYALNEISNEYDGTYILAEKEHSIIISYMGLKPLLPVFSDEFNESSFNQTNKILLSRNLKDIRFFFETNKVGYLIVDEQLKKRLSEKNEGILFIVKNKEAFIRIYSGPKFEVYKYVWLS